MSSEASPSARSISLSGGSVHQASVLIAPGQPFSPNGSPILSYKSSPRAINEIVTSASALKRAAAKAQMPISQLRGHVHTETVSTGAGSAASRGSVLIRVTVTGHKPRKVEEAADALGVIVVTDTTDQFVTRSIATLKGQARSFNRRLATVEKLIDTYNQTLASESLAPLDKLVLVTQLDAAVARQGNLNDKLASNDERLTLTQSIEKAQILTPFAVAEKTTARSRRNSILVGALIGLIVGVIAAIIVDRRASRSAAV